MEEFKEDEYTYSAQEKSGGRSTSNISFGGDAYDPDATNLLLGGDDQEIFVPFGENSSRVSIQIQDALDNETNSNEDETPDILTEMGF